MFAHLWPSHIIAASPPTTARRWSPATFVISRNAGTFMAFFLYTLYEFPFNPIIRCSIQAALIRSVISWCTYLVVYFFTFAGLLWMRVLAVKAHYHSAIYYCGLSLDDSSVVQSHSSQFTSISIEWHPFLFHWMCIPFKLGSFILRSCKTSHILVGTHWDFVPSHRGRDLSQCCPF